MSTIERADNMAEIKVTMDTAFAWALLPQGTLQTAGPFLGATASSLNINKQLLLSDFAITLQRMSTSGAPNSMLE